MKNDQSEKICNLSKNIVNNGMLNPSELVIVTPSESDKKIYFVLEGNRRVTALKILSNPSLIATSHASYYKRIKELEIKCRQKTIYFSCFKTTL